MNGASEDKIRATIYKYLERFEADKVALMETNLNLSDKISLVYLLYDDPSRALECLIDRCHSNIVTEWCNDLSRKRQNEWKLRMIESLILMQNFKRLKVLGYNKRELNDLKTLLSLALRSPEFNKRKVMYSILDDLSVDKLGKLISTIEGNKFREPKELYKTEHIEIFLLHWQITGEIRYDKEGLNNFHRTLNDLNVDSKDILMKFIQSNPEDKDSEVTAKDDLPSYEESMKIHSMANNSDETDRIMSDSDRLRSLNTSDGIPIGFYPIFDKKRVGICIAVNQENYQKHSNHRIRTGSQCDLKRLYKTMSVMNIDSYTLQDLNHNEIFPEIEKIIHNNFIAGVHSVLVVIIMAHGEKGLIYGVDGIGVDTESIRDSLTCTKFPALKGIPKIIIFQSCRGEFHYDASYLATDGPPNVDPVRVKSSMDDYVLCYSTIPGFKSYRHIIEGSLYIQTLCDCLELMYKKEHISNILTFVKAELEKKTLKYFNNTIGMASEFSLGLNKNLYLFQK